MKVAIIGGGVAGLATAWLLDKECEVHLFEKQNRLGGHAHTNYLEIDGKIVPIEAGFEFFSEHMFPYFCQLLKILALPINSFALTSTFYTLNEKELYVLPPWQRGKFFLKTVFSAQLFKLLQFKYFITKGRKIVSNTDTSLTLEEFADTLLLTSDFKNNFLYPFLGAGWGAHLSEFKTFAAYDVLTWLIKNEPHGLKSTQWSEVSAGTSAYIKALSDQLSTAKVQLSANIMTIGYTNNCYTIQDATGGVSYFDHLIIATNAYDAHNLLKNIPEAEKARSALSKVSYFPTAIAIHGDRSFMPKHESDWFIANVYYDGSSTSLTTYKSWKSDTPVFRSWITPYLAHRPLPQPLYSLEYFFHAKVNKNYFLSQELIKDLQGKNNVWFAGLYTQGIDSHESALNSAITLAERLAPHSKRLHSLTHL